MTTRYVVPAIKCGSADKEVVPSLFASSPTSTSAVRLFVGCVKGKARYYPSFIVNGRHGTYPSAAARPGDKIVLHENCNFKMCSLSLVDKTFPDVNTALTGIGAASFSGAGVGDMSFSGLPPNFGKVTFSNSTLNGQAFRLAPGLARFNMVNSGMTLQLKTSRFATDGGSFRTIFEHS